MNPQLTMFGQNIFLLIGLALLLAIVAVLLFVAIMGWRVWRFQKQQAAVEREFAARYGKSSTHSPGSSNDGGDAVPHPSLPPMAQGICDECGKVFAKVYHLPEGGRLCKVCFSKRPAQA